MLSLATVLEQLENVVIIYATRVMNCFLEESETVVVSATSSCGARGERLSSSSALFANDHGARLLEFFSDDQVFHRALVMSLTLSDFSEIFSSLRLWVRRAGQPQRRATSAVHSDCDRFFANV